MKKFLAILGLAAVLGAAVLVSNAKALGTGPNGGYAQSSTFALTWESLGVAAGAIITTPVFSLANATDCEIVADNSAGGVSRALTATWFGADGTTALYVQSVTVTNGTRALVTIGPESSAAATLPTGVTVIPASPGRRMGFSLAAAGAAAGSLAVYCK